MLLAGLQKLTLLDFPGHTACTVFTHGCNLRCPFCHNAALVVETPQDTITEEDFFAFLRKRQGVLDGVAVTGGEPLLQHDVADFLSRIRSLGYAVKLDTNGFFPDKLKALCAEGLVDYVAVDLKNCLTKYGVTVGKNDLDLSPLLETVDFLLRGTVEYEFRTTVVDELHTPDDIASIGKLIAGAPRWFLQQFTDSGGLIASGMHPKSKEELRVCLKKAQEYVPSAALRGID